jgi:hypothetical protein
MSTTRADTDRGHTHEDNQAGGGRRKEKGTHHVLATLHELLVDDLAGKVLAGLDVDRLLHDRVRPAPERLARAVLSWGKISMRTVGEGEGMGGVWRVGYDGERGVCRYTTRGRTWQGTVAGAGMLLECACRVSVVCSC